MSSPGGGSIDFSEFVNMMGTHTSNIEDTDTDVQEAFKTFDKSGNGYLSEADLRTVMANLGENLTEEEVHIMMQEADLDRDGKISYEGSYKTYNFDLSNHK